MNENTPTRLAEGGGSTADELAAADLLSVLPDADASDIAVARVWRKVAPQPKVKRTPLPRWFVIGAPALCAFVLVVIGSVRLMSFPQSEIVLASGGVYFSRPAQPWAMGDNGQVIEVGERIRSDASGNALLRISEVSTVLLAPRSDVAAEKLSGGTVLRLSKGSLTARVKKRPPGQPFIVETDRFTVRVVGTLFSVTQSTEGNIAVSVREGTVQVLDHDDVIARVTAGESWKSDAAGAPKGADETSDSTVILLEEGLAHRPAQSMATIFEAATHPIELPIPSLTSAIPAAVAVPAAPEKTRAGVTPAVPGKAKASIHATELAPEPVAAPLKTEPLMVPLPFVEKTVVRVEAIPASELDLARESVAIAAPPRPQAVAPPQRIARAPVVAPARPEAGAYERAQQLQASGDFRGAAAELEKVVGEGSARSESALFQLGRISMTKLDDSSRALGAFQKYVQRYPEGIFLPEVDLSVLEIDLKHASAGESLAQASRFLQAHPTDEHAEEVRLIRGDLHRERGEFADAMTDYSSIRRPALADDALYSLAYCQRKLGDRNAAAATLNDYLARFPNGKHHEEAKHALAEKQADEQVEKK